MNLKLADEYDQQAIQHACNLSTVRSIAQLVAHAAVQHCPEDVDFSCTIAKAMLPHSYRSNPTVLAERCKQHALSMNPISFRTHRGCDLGSSVSIWLFRDDKRDVRPLSLLKLVIRWLESEQEGELIVPLTNVPISARQRPEQFTYTVKRQTQTRIKIKKLKTQWNISRNLC